MAMLTTLTLKLRQVRLTSLFLNDGIGGLPGELGNETAQALKWLQMGNLTFMPKFIRDALNPSMCRAVLAVAVTTETWKL